MGVRGSTGVAWTAYPVRMVGVVFVTWEILWCTIFGQMFVKVLNVCKLCSRKRSLLVTLSEFFF